MKMYGGILMFGGVALLLQGLFWPGLLGLQVLAMGFYLTVVGSNSNSKVLLLRLLFLVPTTLYLAQTWPWLLLIALSETLTCSYLLRSQTRAIEWQPGQSPKTDAPPKDSLQAHHHNLLLGLFPLAEGLICMVCPSRAGGWLFGTSGPSDPTLVTYFGIHSFHLGLFWYLMVYQRRWNVLRASILGRAIVALAFLKFATMGLASPLHLRGLAGALFFSCAWSLWALRRKW